MGKALIIGCGGVASVAITNAARTVKCSEEICIASRTKSKCDALKESWKDRQRQRLQPPRWMPIMWMNLWLSLRR